jgi:hypothetical protein
MELRSRSTFGREPPPSLHPLSLALLGLIPGVRNALNV